MVFTSSKYSKSFCQVTKYLWVCMYYICFLKHKLFKKVMRSNFKPKIYYCIFLEISSLKNHGWHQRLWFDKAGRFSSNHLENATRKLRTERVFLKVQCKVHKFLLWAGWSCNFHSIDLGHWKKYLSNLSSSLIMLFFSKCQET